MQLIALMQHAPGAHSAVVTRGSPLHLELLRRGMPVLAIASPRVRPVARVISRWVRARGAHVVAAHSSWALRWTSTVGCAPVVVHRRVDFAPSVAGARRMTRAAGVIAVSAAVATVCRHAGVPYDRVHVVPDGVTTPPLPDSDPRLDLGLQVGTPLIVAVGALVPHKGHAVLVRALAAVPSTHVAIVGQGPLAGSLRHLAARHGVARRVHLVGQRDDVPRWQHHADLVCHPSLEEGLGQAAIEALMCGTPVVASRVGGLAELTAGMIASVPPGDPARLAAALRHALRHRGRLAAAVRLRWPWLEARYGTEAMVAGTLAAYTHFAAEAAGAR